MVDIRSSAALNPSGAQSWVAPTSVQPDFAFFHNLGGTAIGRNFSLLSGAANGTRVGSPALTAGVVGSVIPGATFNGYQTYINSPMVESADMTLFAVLSVPGGITASTAAVSVLASVGQKTMVNIDYNSSTSKSRLRVWVPTTGTTGSNGAWENDIDLGLDLTTPVLIGINFVATATGASVRIAVPRASIDTTLTAANQFANASYGTTMMIGGNKQANLSSDNQPAIHSAALGWSSSLSDTDFSAALAGLQKYAAAFGAAA